jgi:hypothetical protein
MDLSHGTSKIIENNEFELFDYIVDKNNNINNDKINNGVDGEGAGIYAMIGNSNESINDAKLYSGQENEGYIYLLSIDIEESDLMHNREPNEIPEEDWIEGIEEFISELHRLHNYSFEKFERIITQSEDLTIAQINSSLKKENLNVTLPSYLNPSEMNFDSFTEEALEFYSIEDPCSYILEEGINNIVENSIDKSDHLQETLYNIWQSCAITQSQNGIETYNKTFQESILKTLGRNHDLTASYVDNDNFAVIFDTSKIKVENIIDFKKELQETNEITQFLNQNNKKSNKLKI